MEFRRWPLDVRQATMLLVTTSCSICSRGASLPFRSTTDDGRSMSDRRQCFLMMSSLLHLLLRVFQHHLLSEQRQPVVQHHSLDLPHPYSPLLHLQPDRVLLSSLHPHHLLLQRRHLLLWLRRLGNCLCSSRMCYTATTAFHHYFFVADISFYVFLICRTSTTVAAPVAGAPKLPSEITGKTVEEVDIWPLMIYYFLDLIYLHKTHSCLCLFVQEEVDTIIPNILRDGPRRLVKNAVRDWSATFRTASRAGQVRRVPPKDKPAAVRDGTGRESPIDISIGIVKN
ncbi:unnamed protein product [Brassica rapa subsp. trilocularis]